MKTFLSLLALCSVAVPCRAEPIEPSDFAYGSELRPLREQAIHAYVLPERVLRALTDRELGDLCVFDATGAQRPSALHVIEDAQTRSAELPVPHFPLEAPPERTPAGVEVRVERDVIGNITRAFSQSLVAPGPSLAGYLVDLSALRDPVTALALTVSAPRDYTLQVELESSDDLSTFVGLRGATLARLEHGGSTLRHDVVALPAALRARYVRISFVRAPSAELRIDAVRARVQTKAEAHARRFVALTPRKPEADERATHQEPTRPGQSFSYAVDGVFRFDRYSVVLPRSTPLSEGSLLSAPRAVGPYRELDRALYRQQPSERPLMPTDHGFFELRISDKGGGVRDGAPTLQLGYLPPQLLFSGNHSASYLLAYGSARARCRRFDEDELASLGDAPLAGAAIADSVRAESPTTLGGPSVLRAPTPSRPLRVYALWGVLVVAVGALAVVARKLLKGT
jgi:hypothetical protein